MRHKTIRYKTALFALFLLMVITGCAPPIPVYSVSRKAWQDAEPDQPWLGPNVKAEAYITMVTYSLGYSENRLEWVDHQKRTVAKGHKVLVQCQKYLESQGLWGQMRGDRDALIMSLSRPHPYELWVKPTRKRYSSHVKSYRRDDDDGLFPGFEEVLVIVCLDPVVVIQGPEPILGVSRLPGYAYLDRDYSARWALNTPEAQEKDKWYYRLPWGFSYGTIVPYSKEPVWFSPDMKAGPQVATYVDENTRVILVPWGKLILERVENNWIVTTLENNKTEDK